MQAKKDTKQVDEWAGAWGDEYITRTALPVERWEKIYLEQYGSERMPINEEFLGDLPRDISILEVGANVGLQLEYLRRAGFSRLTGIEINRQAIEESKHLHPDVSVVYGSGFDIPFGDASYDLVFTSGVLIHISPDDIEDIVREMHRVSRRYIWGFEYFAPEYTNVEYRGRADLLWKTDFCRLFTSTFPDLRVVKEKKYPMTDGKNVSQMYLLEKNS